MDAVLAEEVVKIREARLAYIIAGTFFVAITLHLFNEKLIPLYQYIYDNYVVSGKTLSTTQFTLGEAVTALGLVIAAFQLKSPTWDMTLRIKGNLKRNLIWILSILALFAILVSSILEPIFGTIPIILIVVYLLFIAAPLSLIIIGEKKANIFNSETAEKFYHTILQSISTGDQKKISAAIDILNANLDCLLDVVSKIDFFYPGKEVNLTDTQKYAYGILEVTVSDIGIADYLVTERLDFLMKYIQGIAKRRLRNNAVGDGFSVLISRLYKNPNSYLFRQEEYSGTGLYASVNNTIFTSFALLVDFSPLSDWGHYDLDEQVLYNEKFIEVFLRSMETVIENYGFSESSIGHRVGYMLFKLNDYARDIVNRDIQPESFNKNKRILQKIEFFYGSTFPEIYTKNWSTDKMSEEDRHPQKERRYDQGLASAYADALVDFLGTIGNYDPRNMLLRSMAISASNDIISFPDNDKEASLKELRRVFFEYTWDAIKLNVEQGYFPAFLRSYVPIIDLHRKDSPAWAVEERRKLVSYLNKTLKPKLKKGEKMSNHRDSMERLLPNDMMYDKKADKLFWVHTDGTKEHIK